MIALNSIGQHAKWLKSLLTDISLLEKPIPAMSIHYDNQAIIAKAKQKHSNKLKRHIRLRLKTLRSLQKYGVIALEYIRTAKNIVDPLTKELARRQVIELTKGMRLKPINRSSNKDRKSTRLNSSHSGESRMPSSA